MPRASGDFIFDYVCYKRSNKNGEYGHMKLQNLSLANFKGFEQLDLDFESDITILAGTNGIGKSSVLYAIAVILSKALPLFTPSRSKPRYFEYDDIFIKKDLTTQFSVTMQLEVISQLINIFIHKTIDDKSDGSDHGIVIIRNDDDEPNEERYRPLNQTRTGGLVVGIKSMYTALSNLKSAKNQPIAVYFSPKRQLPDRPRSLPEQKPFKISQAYNFALNDREVELREFLDWFRVQEKLGSATKILDSLRAVITEFIPEFTNLQIREQPTLAFVVEKSGKPFQLHQLSDGERGLLAIVFDLTRRLAIANPESTNPIVEGSAIVLIDEIELHLHPTWQRQILRRFTSTFKNCQFIVTTHSPQVIGQAKAEKLRLLYPDEQGRVMVTTPGQALGMDSSWILQNIMGASARDYETEQKLSAIFESIDQDDYESARSGIVKLSKEVGNFPDLQEASSLLDGLELLGQHEED
jgi:predicted ATP-binding protein involved in virulence